MEQRRGVFLAHDARLLSAVDSQVGSVPLIRASGVTKTYPSKVETVWAVRDVNLAAHPGQFVCVFGASGSGKSTLLNLLAGLDLPDSGEIQVGDHDVGRLDESGRAQLRLRSIGVVFQDHNLIEEFTAVENVALPLEASGVRFKAAHDEGLWQLARVDLSGLDARFPHELSGGQRQRVGVARALTGERAILLADEPTGSLDSAATTELFALIRALCNEGLLAVVCSHDPECRRFADTVYEMTDGCLAPA